ncbi:MAG: hypothetical protein ACQKBV_04835 [Puniceicoccales bacterium]
MIARLFILLTAFAFALAPTSAQAQETARIEVILVMASNSGQGVDPSLKPYADTLQRLFAFNSYQQRDRKQLSIPMPGGQTTNLFGGTTLQLGLQLPADGKLPVDLNWQRGKEKLLRTVLRLNPGTPAIVGGPQAENNTGSYLLIVNWRS